MNLQNINQLMAFNHWANHTFFDALMQLPAEQYERDLQSSHGGIHGTLAHLIGAEKGWLSRWRQQPQGTAADSRQITTMTGLRTHWEGVSAEMHRYLDTLDDHKLQDTLTTQSTSGLVTVTYWQMILHVVDHSSYHRGQIVTMLRQLGVTPPSAGMMRFYRETGSPG